MSQQLREFTLAVGRPAIFSQGDGGFLRRGYVVEHLPAGEYDTITLGDSETRQGLKSQWMSVGTDRITVKKVTGQDDGVLTVETMVGKGVILNLSDDLPDEYPEGI